MFCLKNRIRHITRKPSFLADDRGLSTVEYVIILVLIAAAAVGTWSKFGGVVTTKIQDANDEIQSGVVIDPNGQSKDST